MEKLNIEKYFKISNFLKSKNEKDFKLYRQNFYKKDKTYKDREKLAYLFEYYKSENSEENEAEKIIGSIEFFEKLLFIVFFILAFAITFLFYNKEVNVYLYLLSSVFLPLAYLLYLAYRHFSYKFPSKRAEFSFLNELLKKKFKDFKDEHSYVIKTYSVMVFIKTGISYTLGVLLATILIFSVYKVTFYTETTYGANDYIEVIEGKKTNKVEANSNTKENISTGQRKHYSSAYWSRLITIVLFIMIALKIVLYFLARRNNRKTIKQALEKQGKDFFNILKTTVYIGGNKEYKQKDISFYKEKEPKNKISDKNENIENFYILYYQIDENEQDNIQFDIVEENKYLKNKNFYTYSYGLFEQEDEDLNTLEKLDNLVIVYTSPQTIPDESFKEDILRIKNGTKVRNIWIVPLKDEDEKLFLLKKDDKDYAKWEKIIKKIDDVNIRIHFDV